MEDSQFELEDAANEKQQMQVDFQTKHLYCIFWAVVFTSFLIIRGYHCLLCSVKDSSVGFETSSLCLKE